jgi:hypothetical protein
MPRTFNDCRSQSATIPGVFCPNSHSNHDLFLAALSPAQM